MQNGISMHGCPFRECPAFPVCDHARPHWEDPETCRSKGTWCLSKECTPLDKNPPRMQTVEEFLENTCREVISTTKLFAVEQILEKLRKDGEKTKSTEFF